jgi:GT2 family glycosyltransferase
MEKVEIAVQVVNFNTKNYLINCLQSVFIDLADSNLSFEVNVLDNNSKDDLSNLKDFFFPFWQDRLKVYKSDKNIGFGAGHNLLAQKLRPSTCYSLIPILLSKNPGL